MAIQTFIVEKGKKELFENLAEKHNCKVIGVWFRDSLYSYVNIHYINVKDIFLLGCDYGSYSSVFISN